MEKSWRDLEMAHRAVAGTPPFYDMAVYHCQQSGEKAVKAFLVLRGISFEKPHDIEVLRAESSRVSGGGGVGPSHLHKRGHCILFAGRLAGGRGRGWAGRRLCRSPAGCGDWMRAPAGALGEGRWGAFCESAEGGCGPRGLVPYREVGGPKGREGG
jgi:hypothetical protein